MNFLIKFFIVNILLISTLIAEVGIVDTNVLLIKKEPSESSVKFGFYKMNDSIDIIGEYDGIDNEDKWFRTKRGYVKADYVILESYLPQFIDESEVDKNKNALQLIVYQSTVVQSLRQLRKNLMNEKNLYLQRSKNVYVIYLVNFDSYSAALKKKKELNNLYPSSFITKIKSTRKATTTRFVEPPELSDERKKQIIEQLEIKAIKTNDIEEEFSLPIEDLKDEEINFDEIADLRDIENNQSVVIEDIKIEQIPRSKVVEKKVVPKVERKVVKEIEKPKVITSIPKPKKKLVEIKEEKKEEKIQPSFTSIMEDLLIKLNE